MFKAIRNRLYSLLGMAHRTDHTNVMMGDTCGAITCKLMVAASSHPNTSTHALNRIVFARGQSLCMAL